MVHASNIVKCEPIIFIDGAANLHQEKLSAWALMVRRDGFALAASWSVLPGGGGGWGARSTAVLPSVQKWGFGAGSKEEELSAASGASVVPLLRVGAAGRYCWCCQDLEGGGGGILRCPQCCVSGQHLPQHTVFLPCSY